MSDLIQEQALLARYGISISESNELADFERAAFVDIALKNEKFKLEMMSPVDSPT